VAVVYVLFTFSTATFARIINSKYTVGRDDLGTPVALCKLKKAALLSVKHYHMDTLPSARAARRVVVPYALCNIVGTPYMASVAAAMCKPLVILSEAKNLLRIAVGFKILRRFALQNDR
jgi:hypothetical protein